MIGLTTLQCQFVVVLSTIEGNTCTGTALSQIEDISFITCLTMLQTVASSRIGSLHAGIGMLFVNVGSYKPASAIGIITRGSEVRLIENLRLIVVANSRRTNRELQIEAYRILLSRELAENVRYINSIGTISKIAGLASQLHFLRETCSRCLSKCLLAKLSNQNLTVNTLVECQRELSDRIGKVE